MEYFSVQGLSPGDGKTLFELAMRGKWSEAVNKFMENPFLLAGGITRTNETLLHIAVSEGQEKTVREITKTISEQPLFISKAIVRKRNNGGNTALDLAAVVGNVAICECIAEVDPSVIVEPNAEGETPLSLAVLFGKKQAFLRLTQMLMQDPDLFREAQEMQYGTPDNTILHYAIREEYYDLALPIIKLYGEQCNVANKKGTTPLHLLAGKPSAFTSGSDLLVLGLWKTIIYHCIFVDEHDVEQNDDHPTICVGFFQLFRNLFSFFTVRCKVREQRDEESPERQPENTELGARNGDWKHRFSPAILYGLFYKIFKLANRAMVVVLILLGIPSIRKIYEVKRQHKLSILIMNELLRSSVDEVYEYYYRGEKHPTDRAVIVSGEIIPSDLNIEDDNGKVPSETAILIAARNGVAEIVEKILELVPVAIHDVNEENKNVVLLAVENKQPHVYQLLLQRTHMLNRDSVFRVVDKEGNSAFHLAASTLAAGYNSPWLIPGEALQMQWEMKWFEFVTRSIPSINTVGLRNAYGQTPEELFIKNHKELVIKGREWLSSTSQSYSVLAALIATVAFATSSSVPGGLKEGIGTPTFDRQPAFHLFVISSLIALCFSVTALVSFLAILTSRHQARDFGKDLPMKLFVGLTSLFASIVAILISFCAGNFLQTEDNILRYVEFPVYAAACLPIAYFAVVHFPLYFDLTLATFTKVPRRSCDIVL